jgi:biotin carboxyl carrier protein
MSASPRSGAARLVQVVADLLAQLDGTAVTECEFRSGQHRILVRRSPSFVPAAPSPAVVDEEVPAHWRAIVSPLSGIYYAAESPQTPPFVTMGAAISIGQPIALIEAMKTFNRVESDISGIVRAILVGNGAEVYAGEPLIYLEPLGDRP